MLISLAVVSVGLVTCRVPLPLLFIFKGGELKGR
jgi:hypothetical protein